MAVPVDGIRFQWTLPIDKIQSELYRPDLFYESDEFKFNDATFYLKVKPVEPYIEDLNDEESMYMYFYLCVRDFGLHESLKVRHRLWLTDDMGRMIPVADDGEQEFVKANYSWANRAFEVHEHQFENTAIRDKSTEVTVFCELYHNEDDIEDQVDEWRRNIEKIADSEITGYCTLRVDGQDFEVAKHILMVQSEVFERMLTADMSETRTGIFSIEDIRAEVISKLVNYLNTGKFDDAEGHLEELFIAADKYAVKELREKCVTLLLETLNESNCLHLLEMAFTHNSPDFRKLIIKCISVSRNKVNFLKLAKTEEWKKFAVSNHQVSNEILDAFFTHVKWTS